MTYIRFLILCAINMIAIHAHAQEFYFGADLSYVNEMEDCGAEYKVNNAVTDPYLILKNAGTNLVRLRLWHTPAWYDNLNDGLRYSDFADVRLSIMRAKAQGMDVLLDFHLSDNWADPSKQVIPAAWAPVVNNLPVLQDSLYNYIYNTLNSLALDGLLPELVQIGNETNRGILLSQEVNDAGWSLNWARNSALFNSAIAAVHDIEALHQQEVKIALHIAGPANVEYYIDQFHDHNVTDFDIIGISYYYQWHDQSLEEVGNIISNLKSDYPEKEVMIFETAYPWTSTNADNANNILSVAYPGYSPFSPVKQKDWMIALTQEVIDNGGTGVVYWEPAWVSTECRTQFALGSSWDNATFFNHEDELIVNGGVLWMTHMYNFPTSVAELNGDKELLKIYQSEREIWLERNDVSVFNGSLRIEFYSLDGKQIYARDIRDEWVGNKIDLKAPDLTGVYLVRVSNDYGYYIAGLYIKI
jgi:arabinogalactan endo-1,4-beta-galactosidase